MTPRPPWSLGPSISIYRGIFGTKDHRGQDVIVIDLGRAGITSPYQKRMTTPTRTVRYLGISLCKHDYVVDLKPSRRRPNFYFGGTHESIAYYAQTYQLFLADINPLK